MLTTVLTGVGTMIPASGRQLNDREFTGPLSELVSELVSELGDLPIPTKTTGRNVTNNLTPRIAGLAAALILLGAPLAQAQEPVVEPEPVVEAPEPVVESEAAPQPVIESEAAQAVSDPPSRVARVGYVDGEVTVAPAGTEEWAEAVLNRPLTSGDRVWVENGGRAELQIGSAAVYLDGDTGFGFIELDDGMLQASLTEGAATLRIRRLAVGETIQVETPHGTVFLNRVGEYHLEVDKAGDRTIVKTRNGEAQVKGGSQTFTVRDNQRGEFAGLENLTGRIEPLESRTAFENWANDRDARNERSESARYVSRDVIGYEDLDDNGEWISEPEYGHVWRPRYVAYDWAPYRYGRWAYVSPWGWSWIDDARWGFAPTHYGRWAHIRNRWCWVPGPRHLRPVYAPALVGWVGGPTVGLSLSFGSGIGWYPLGPRDVFYPGYRHTPRYIRYVNVSNTIIVNNNYFYGGRHRHPPDFDHRRYRHAVTAVSRDQFVGGRPIHDHRIDLDESHLRSWRGDNRPPAIAPYRESVLAGQPRRGPRDGDRFRGNHAFTAGRVPFHTERSAIEANGGRPLTRSELQNRNPKEGNGFRAIRQGSAAGDIKRAERDRTQGMGFSGSNRDRDRDRDRPARELNNDSVRDWQAQRDRERGGSSPRYNNGGSNIQPRNAERDRRMERDRDNRERLEVMRAEESRQESRRRDHFVRPPSNSFQQGNSSNSFDRSPKERAREQSRGSSPVFRNDPPRQVSPPRESRRDFSPPPRQQTRQEPRSQPQPRSSPQPRQHRENGGSRPRTTTQRER